MRSEVGRLDLTKDFSFAQHHRIETTGDFEEVAHAIVVAILEQMAVQRCDRSRCVRMLIVILAEKPTHALRHFLSVAGQPVHFDAVASGENRGFVQTGCGL